MNSVCKDLYTVLCAVRRSGWTWQSSFWILAFASTVALSCQNTSQNACHGCEKCKKSNPIRIFFWRTKISEAVCKRDWHNVRSYLFFNVRNVRTKNSDSVCNGLKFSVFSWCMNCNLVVSLIPSIPVNAMLTYWTFNPPFFYVCYPFHVFQDSASVSQVGFLPFYRNHVWCYCNFNVLIPFPIFTFHSVEITRPCCHIWQCNVRGVAITAA